MHEVSASYRHTDLPYDVANIVYILNALSFIANQVSTVGDSVVSQC